MKLNINLTGARIIAKWAYTSRNTEMRVAYPLCPPAPFQSSASCRECNQSIAILPIVGVSSKYQFELIRLPLIVKYHLPLNRIKTTYTMALTEAGLQAKEER